MRKIIVWYNPNKDTYYYKIYKYFTHKYYIGYENQYSHKVIIIIENIYIYKVPLKNKVIRKLISLLHKFE